MTTTYSKFRFTMLMAILLESGFTSLDETWFDIKIAGFVITIAALIIFTIEHLKEETNDEKIKRKFVLLWLALALCIPLIHIGWITWLFKYY